LKKKKKNLLAIELIGKQRSCQQTQTFAVA